MTEPTSKTINCERRSYLGLDFEPAADHVAIINFFDQAGAIWIHQQFAEASLEIRYAVLTVDK